MYKYLLFIIIGILLYLLRNIYNTFNIGIPNEGEGGGEGEGEGGGEGGTGIEGTCSICLEEYSLNDPLVQACSSGHYFHQPCLNTLIAACSRGVCEAACPMCREIIRLVPADLPQHPGRPHTGQDTNLRPPDVGQGLSGDAGGAADPGGGGGTGRGGGVAALPRRPPLPGGPLQAAAAAIVAAAHTGGGGGDGEAWDTPDGMEMQAMTGGGAPPLPGQYQRPGPALRSPVLRLHQRVANPCATRRQRGPPQPVLQHPQRGGGTGRGGGVAPLPRRPSSGGGGGGGGADGAAGGGDTI